MILDDILVENIAVSGGDGWFVERKHDALFWVDLSMHQCRLLTILPNDTQINLIYSICVKINNELYIFPGVACGNILILNLDSGGWTEIKLENPKRKNVWIRWYCLYKEHLYVVAFGLKKVFDVDIMAKKIVGVYSVHEDVVKWNVESQMCLMEHEVYMANAESNRIYILDLESKEMTYTELPSNIQGIYGMGTAGKKIWLTSKKKSLFLMDTKTKTIEEISIFPKEFGRFRLDINGRLYIDKESLFDEGGISVHGAYLKRCIWLVPKNYNKILCVNLETNESEVISIPQEEEDDDTWKRRKRKFKFLLVYTREKRYLGIYSFKNNWFIELDTITKSLEIKDFIFLKEDVLKLEMTREKRRGFLMESNNSMLTDWLKKNKFTGYKTSKEIGNNIYNNLKNN